MKIKLVSDGQLKELFAPSKKEIYNYAPCLIQTDENTKYVFYCTNRESAVIVDYIGWRKGVLRNGDWVWGEEHIALSPGESGWDCTHVCDPDLIKGEFHYNGYTYSWALFYLGCDKWDCNHNQIGVAFAGSIEGPWVKFDGNPVIPGECDYWGTGQCSQVSIDEKGKFRVIYREDDAGGTSCKMVECDFSDMSRYKISAPVSISWEGLPTWQLGMSHAAYDPTRKVYYMVAEKDWDGKVRCCKELVIAVMDAASFESGDGAWQVLTVIDQAATGKYGNHNAAVVRDSYGRIWSTDVLDIALSSGEQTFIWDFRICEMSFRLLETGLDELAPG